MPRAKILTDRKIDLILQDIIKGEDKDAAMKGIKLKKEIEQEARAKKQLQRDKVTRKVVIDKALQEMLKFYPHGKQQDVLNSPTEEVVICAGRQAGKTILCAYIALRALLESNMAILLVAPTYTLTDRVMDYLRTWIGKYFKNEIRVINKPFPKVVTKWGSFLDGKSTEKPEQILGKGYNLRIIDECARTSEQIFHTYIIPASGIELGKSIYISTPRGRDWFWRLWRKAGERGGAFHWTSIESPYFDKKKWDEAKSKLPDFVFRQEYMAEFLEEAMVFQGFGNCLKEYQYPQEYNEKHLYVVGVDLGRYENYTDISVMDLMTNQEVNNHRFQGEWELQKKKITSVADRYGHCPIWIDATSITVGDAYVGELENAGYNVTGYKIQSNVSKRQLVEKLIVMVQNQGISFPNDEVGTEDSQEANTECRAYSFDVSPSGNIIYNAPQGEYDDCVIARALACWELNDQPLPEMKKGEPDVIIPPKQEF